MQKKMMQLRDFSGGLNTAAAISTLPPNMSPDLQNVDILDSRSITRRNGYAVVTASPLNGANAIAALYRYYKKDGTKQWLCVAGTALIAVGVIGTAGRIEAETGYIAASSSVSATIAPMGWFSGGAAVMADVTGTHTYKVNVPKSDRLTFGYGFSHAAGVTASYRIDGGAWVSFTASLSYNLTTTVSGLTATNHAVYVRAYQQEVDGKPCACYFDYIDWANGTTSTHKDTTLTASSSAYGFATLNDNVYYGTAFDAIRGYNGSITASVTASGSCTAGYIVEGNRRLFAAGNDTDRAKLYYTDLDQPEDWTGGGEIYLAGKDSGGECTGLAFWRLRLYYFAPSRIYALDTRGDTTNWSTGGEPISHSVGCVAPGTLTKVPNGLVFLSGQGVHLYGMGGEFTQEPGFTVLSENIAPDLHGIPEASLTTACGAYYKNRYWLACDADGDGANNVVYVYRFPESGLPGSWTRYRYEGISITCLETTRDDEPGLYAGCSDGRIVKLDDGTNDGGSPIEDYYVTPPITPDGFDSIKHFRPCVYVGVQSDTTQSLTVTPSTDDVDGDARTVTVTPNTAIQTIRVPLSARGRALTLRFSGSGAAQPRTLTSIGVPFLPPRIR